MKSEILSYPRHPRNPRLNESLAPNFSVSAFQRLQSNSRVTVRYLACPCWFVKENA